MLRKIFWKKFIIGVVVVILVAISIEPVNCNIECKKNFTKEDKCKTNQQEIYLVAFGPPLSKKNKNIDLLNVFMNLSKEDAINFKTRFLAIDSETDISTEEKIDNKLGILREYGILPNEFTLENLTKYNKVRSADITNPTLGLHCFIFASAFGRANYLNWPPGTRALRSNITRLADLVDIPNELIWLLGNVTIFTYMAFLSAQILIGGPIDLYIHIPFLATGSFEIISLESFIGTYLPMVSVGLYIYSAENETQEPNPEFPFLDIIIGFSIISYWTNIRDLTIG
jgi:hypothetical protein